jgi:flagellar biosynthesis protein FlhF
VVALAGPTGVGKTTTLAKLAASWRVDRRLRVGIVAADAFRVGAVEQLRTYGNIIDAPVQAAHGPASAAEALARLADCDVVLVDTPGRGHRDAMRIGEVAETVRAVRADESLLVLPGSASAGTLSESADAFRAVAPTRVVLSKLDESEGLGALVGAVRRSDRPAAWFTTGQGVPDDLERADARAFAERLVGPAPDAAGEAGGPR